MIKTVNNKAIVTEIAFVIYNQYIDYYYTVDFNYLIEIVDNTITDLQGVIDINDIHNHIIITYI